ncbi:hypothetical protein [Nocardia sp. NPDC051570]|uniref:hypothetical protein n=1 Tax=Nocardia sp. NPDC051570 TaxID=3364324 RepID=UPI0037BB6B32
MSFERGLLVEALLPRGWLVLAAVVLGIAVFVALLVLLLVSGSNFHEPVNDIPKGSCYPFCTASPEPPPPGWQ